MTIARVLTDDLRGALRSLIRRPLLSSIAVLMLALGLGFGTALFAVADAVLLAPLPYREPGRIVMLWTGRNPDGTGGVNSYADFLVWQSEARGVSAMAAYNISFGTLTGHGDPEELDGAVVSPRFFEVLGVGPAAGRWLQPGDELVGVDAARPIVISHALWTTRFSGDPAILERTLTLSGRSRRIVGVAPREFQQPDPFWGAEADYWSPMLVADEMRTAYGSRFLRVIARLGDDVSLEAVRQEMDAIGRRLMAAYPSTHPASVVVGTIEDELAGDARPLALAFLAATVLVMLLVVVNVANLLLIRINQRRGELAIRVALGAGRGRMIAHVVTESVVIGLAGGLAGLLVAAWGLDAARRLWPGELTGISAAGLNGRVLVFSIALAVITGALCGVWPAVRVARSRLAGLLSGARTTTGLEVTRRRTLVIAMQIALAVPLLAGAALLVRTVLALHRVEPGFDAARLMHFRVSLPGARYGSDESRALFFETALDRLRALPGVTAAGAASSLPLGGLNNTGGSIVYERPDGSLRETGVGTRIVAGDYFRALGVPIVRGRTLTGGADDARSVVINERAANALWPGSTAIGRRLRLGQLADPPDAVQQNPWLTVVGVVGDMRHEGLGRPSNPEIFRPYRTGAWSTMMLVARTDGDPAALAGPIRTVMRGIDSLLPLVNLMPVTALVEGQFLRPRFGAFCALVFGGLGVLLAAAGTFAVLGLFVTQRTKEIGIRLALGATPGRVGGFIVRQSMLPALSGGVVGALAAAWVTRSLEPLLVDVSARDPLALAGSVVVVLAAALAASWLPVRRAMRTDPIATLRMD